MGLIDIDRLNAPCSCGRAHTPIDMRYVTGDITGIPALCAEVIGEGPTKARGAKIALICDENTYRVAGARARRLLEDAGYTVEAAFLKGMPPHTEDGNIGIAVRAAQGAALVLAVGSGTVCDVARMAALGAKLPLCEIGTALSMDGYASSVAPVLVEEFKRTMNAEPAKALLSDAAVLLSAPLNMAAAGVGDMAGKIIALLDWQLAHICEGEAVCEETMNAVARAANAAIAAAGSIAASAEDTGSAGEAGSAAGAASDATPECAELTLAVPSPSAAQAAHDLMDGLVLSGMTISRLRSSRPASGCEHMIAHFLEDRDNLLKRGENFHGARVGVATLYMLKIYELFFAKRREPVPGRRCVIDMEGLFLHAAPQVKIEAGNVTYAPFEQEHARLLDKWDQFKPLVDAAVARAGEIKSALAALGGPVTMAQMGYDREEVKNALLYAKDIRTRFGLLRLMDRWGVLEDIAVQALEALYE